MLTTLTQRTQQICALNDQFRTTFTGGRVVLTGGTMALTDEDRVALFAAVKSFQDFTPDNDPHGEHDFGAVTLRDMKFYWKIDCYDRDLLNHSPDATDTKLTVRVLTIMRDQEY